MYIAQIEKDTNNQSKDTNFFKHCAGRIGASQSKSASHSNPALPSQSLIQNLCYPELNRFFSKAVQHGCDQDAIKAYEEQMKKVHTNFKVIPCGLMVNEDHPWLHATPDFLCTCDCHGDCCGEVKCPYCIENLDFDNYILKKSSCLHKASDGSYFLKPNHQYYYQVQQQLFIMKRSYCDFVVCSFGKYGETKFVVQRIVPDEDHWDLVLPKLKTFWRTCVLPEILAKWYTRKHQSISLDQVDQDGICYCCKAANETTITCCNPKCAINKFHTSCLEIENPPQTWYCPHCRTLPNFKSQEKSTKRKRKFLAKWILLLPKWKSFVFAKANQVNMTN